MAVGYPKRGRRAGVKTRAEEARKKFTFFFSDYLQKLPSEKREGTRPILKDESAHINA